MSLEYPEGTAVAAAIGGLNTTDRFATIQQTARLSPWHLTAALQVADLVAIFASLAFSFTALPLSLGERSISSERWIIEAVVAAVPLYLALHLAGGYSSKLLIKPGIYGVTVVTVLTAISAPLFILLTMELINGESDTRFAIVGWYVEVVFLLTALRVACIQIHKRLSNAGWLAHTVCIVGDGAEAGSCLRHFEEDKSNNILLGYFSAEDRRDGLVTSARYLGHIDRLATFLRRQRVDQVIVATAATKLERLGDLISELRSLPVSISIWPETFNLPLKVIATSGNRLGTIPLLPVGSAPLSGWSWVVKDVQDRTLAALLLLACLPVLIIIAIAIRARSPGPVLFRQMREG